MPFIVCHFLQVLIFRDNVSITKNTCKFLLQQNNFCINLLNNLLYFLQYFFFILAYDRSRNGCEAKPRKDETGLPATLHLPIRQIPRGCLILLYTMVRFHEIFCPVATDFWKNNNKKNSNFGKSETVGTKIFSLWSNFFYSLIKLNSSLI